MFARLMVVLLVAAALAVALLGLRQQRLEIAHDIARSTRRIEQTRLQLWNLQAQVSNRVQPLALTEAIDRAQLKMQPLTPLPAQTDKARDRVKIAERNTPRRREH